MKVLLRGLFVCIRFFTSLLKLLYAYSMSKHFDEMMLTMVCACVRTYTCSCVLWRPTIKTVTFKVLVSGGLTCELGVKSLTEDGLEMFE